jgi:glycosyltransferase involved in cell wall biosynthesis
MLRINYISYLDPFTFSGGGEVVLRSLLEWGKKNLGIQLNIVTRKPKIENYDENADFNIFADYFNVPNSFKKQNVQFLKKILKEKPFIHFDNAYVDVCDLDYLPCNGVIDKKCKYKMEERFLQKIRRGDFQNNCSTSNEMRSLFYQRSKLNIFVSPLHQSIHNKINQLSSGRQFVLRPLIDNSKFKNEHISRDIKYLYVGSINEAKGVNNLRDFFKDKKEKLVMIGSNNSGEDLSFATELGFVSYDKLPSYFNRAENFIHLPRWPEPQGRTVIEAALCGCNLITNENVGATSFEFDLTDGENYQDVEKEFWDNVKAAINN